MATNTDGRIDRSNGQVIDLSEVKEHVRLVDSYIRELQELNRLKKSEEVRKLKECEKRSTILKRAIKEFAVENGLEEVTGTLGRVKFSETLRRSVDPVAFLNFLVKVGKRSRFMDYVSIPVGRVCADFGENVLSSADVIQYHVDDFGKISINGR